MTFLGNISGRFNSNQSELHDWYNKLLKISPENREMMKSVCKIVHLLICLLCVIFIISCSNYCKCKIYNLGAGKIVLYSDKHYEYELEGNLVSDGIWRKKFGKIILNSNYSTDSFRSFEIKYSIADTSKYMAIKLQNLKKGVPYFCYILFYKDEKVDTLTIFPVDTLIKIIRKANIEYAEMIITNFQHNVARSHHFNLYNKDTLYIFFDYPEMPGFYWFYNEEKLNKKKNILYNDNFPAYKRKKKQIPF